MTKQAKLLVVGAGALVCLLFLLLLVSEYMLVVNSRATFTVRSDLPRVYSRVIDHSIQQGNTGTARQVAQKAAEKGLVLSLASPQGQQLFAQAKTAVVAERQKQKAGNKGTNGGSNYQKARDEASAANLKSMSVDEIYRSFGTPSETRQSPNKSNLRLAIWNRSDSRYIGVSYVEAIDGSGRKLILAADIYSDAGRLKRTFDSLK